MQSKDPVGKEENVQVDLQEEELKVVKSIEEAMNEYNESLESLGTAEDSVKSVETEMFKILVSAYKQNNGITVPQDQSTDYNVLFARMAECKDHVSQKTNNSLRLLQKFNKMHTSYLINVINSLKAKLEEAQKMLTSKQGPDAMGAESQPSVSESVPVEQPATSSSGLSRASNRLSSVGRV